MGYASYSEDIQDRRNSDTHERRTDRMIYSNTLTQEYDKIAKRNKRLTERNKYLTQKCRSLLKENEQLYDWLGDVLDEPGRKD